MAFKASGWRATYSGSAGLADRASAAVWGRQHVSAYEHVERRTHFAAHGMQVDGSEVGFAAG